MYLHWRENESGRDDAILVHHRHPLERQFEHDPNQVLVYMGSLLHPVVHDGIGRFVILLDLGSHALPNIYTRSQNEISSY